MKAFILVLSLTIVASSALAQSETEPPSASRVAKLQQMKKSLGLTDQQVSEMREAGGSRDDMRAVLSPEQQAKAVKLRQTHKGRGGDRKRRLQQLDLSDEQMTQIHSIRQEGGSPQQVRAVLTPQQRVKLDTLRESASAAGAQEDQ